MWDDLMKKGLRIRHFRCMGDLMATAIYRKVEDGETTPIGISYVSEHDSPSLEKGRQMAYQRFLKAEQGQSRQLWSNPLIKFIGGDNELWSYAYVTTTPSEIKNMILKFQERNKETTESNIEYVWNNIISDIMNLPLYDRIIVKDKLVELINEFITKNN